MVNSTCFPKRFQSQSVASLVIGRVERGVVFEVAVAVGDTTT